MNRQRFNESIDSWINGVVEFEQFKNSMIRCIDFAAHQADKENITDALYWIHQAQKDLAALERMGAKS